MSDPRDTDDRIRVELERRWCEPARSRTGWCAWCGLGPYHRGRCPRCGHPDGQDATSGTLRQASPAEPVGNQATREAAQREVLRRLQHLALVGDIAAMQQVGAEVARTCRVLRIAELHDYVVVGRCPPDETEMGVDSSACPMLRLRRLMSFG